MNPRRQRTHELAAACGSLPSGIEQHQHGESLSKQGQ